MWIISIVSVQKTPGLGFSVHCTFKTTVHYPLALAIRVPHQSRLLQSTLHHSFRLSHNGLVKKHLGNWEIVWVSVGKLCFNLVGTYCKYRWGELLCCVQWETWWESNESFYWTEFYLGKTPGSSYRLGSTFSGVVPGDSHKAHLSYSWVI